MQIDRKELKHRARELMALTRPAFWKIALVYLLLTTGASCALNGLFTLFPDAAPLKLFLTILILMLGTVLEFGYVRWTLQTAREEEPAACTLFDGFSHVGPVLLTTIGVVVFIFLFLLMFMIPLALVFGVVSVVLASSVVGRVVFTFILTCVLYVCVLFIGYRYEFAVHSLSDAPERGASAAIRRSVELMRGWKWEYFKLEFSFFGWYLLAGALPGIVAGVLSFLGVVDLPTLSALAEGPFAFSTALELPPYDTIMAVASLPVMLWLLPYHSVSSALFYDARVQLAAQDAPPVLPVDTGDSEAPF